MVTGLTEEANEMCGSRNAGSVFVDRISMATVKECNRVSGTIQDHREEQAAFEHRSENAALIESPFAVNVHQ